MKDFLFCFVNIPHLALNTLFQGVFPGSNTFGKKLNRRNSFTISYVPISLNTEKKKLPFRKQKNIRTELWTGYG